MANPIAASNYIFGCAYNNNVLCSQNANKNNAIKLDPYNDKTFFYWTSAIITVKNDPKTYYKFTNIGAGNNGVLSYYKVIDKKTGSVIADDVRQSSYNIATSAWELEPVIIAEVAGSNPTEYVYETVNIEGNECVLYYLRLYNTNLYLSYNPTASTDVSPFNLLDKEKPVASAWSSSIIYSADSMSTYDSKTWVSNIDNNENNTPSSSSSIWPAWDYETYYSAGDKVSYNNEHWISRIDDNVANTPEEPVDPEQSPWIIDTSYPAWTEAVWTEWDDETVYSICDRVYYNNKRWKSLITNNVNKTPKELYEDDEETAWVLDNAGENSTQKFYFIKSTYIDPKLAAPSSIANNENLDYFITNKPNPITSSTVMSFKPRWTTSNKTNKIYEIRYKSQLYDMEGALDTSTISEWTPWQAFVAQMCFDEKKKFMNCAEAVDYEVYFPDGVNNKDHCRAEVIIEIRMTNAADMAKYESNFVKTTHSSVASETIGKNTAVTQYCKPEIDFTAAIYSPDGLALTYSTDYYVSGTYIQFNSIKNATIDSETDEVIPGDILVSDQKFQIPCILDPITGKNVGDLYFSCDELNFIPKAGETLVIDATLVEENEKVKTDITKALICQYAASYQLEIDPKYYYNPNTDEFTVLGVIETYDVTQCYMATFQLDGNVKWIECKKVANTLMPQWNEWDSTKTYNTGDRVSYDDQHWISTVDNNTATPGETGWDLDTEEQKDYSIFEIVPPYNELPVLMWVCVDENADWTSTITSPPDICVSSNSYSWYWLEEKNNQLTSHVTVLKYQAGDIMKPSDTITLSANEFLTTGREYPVYRYTKSVKRTLDIEGVILNTEEDENAIKSAFEAMASEGHFIYRQPDGKWYQVAVQSITFSREKEYVKVQIKQEAETR